MATVVTERDTLTSDELLPAAEHQRQRSPVGVAGPVDPTEEMPRFRLTRMRKDDRSRYFGPFAHSGLLRKTLAQMHKQFGILLGDASPRKLPDGSWQIVKS